MEQKIINLWKYFNWYNTLSISKIDGGSDNGNEITNNGFLYEQFALALMVSLTLITLYRIPSWQSTFTDPCHIASILCGATVLLMFITRLLGPRALAFEPIVMMLFLAGMPLVYIASYLIMGDGFGSMWFWVEILGLPIYVLLAMLGLKRSPWFLVVGIAAHGLAWDIWHYPNSTYIPTWYATGCLFVDIGISIYLAARIPAWRTLEQ